MPTSPSISDTTRWYDRLWAAFIFFTRLPLWRLHQPPKACYSRVVEHWPLVGWLTGSFTATILWFGCYLLPYPIVVLVAVTARMLLTGALHEDGLADFVDGFGAGGSDRERILDIMKDSRIGTYGVLALLLYVGLLATTLYTLGPYYAALTMMMADPYAKMLAAQVVMMLPYARTADTAKARTVYRQMGIREGILLAVQGLTPMLAYCWWLRDEVDWQMLVVVPCLAMFVLYRLVAARLRGYTGDCCGALCLLTELATLLTAAYYLSPDC